VAATARVTAHVQVQAWAQITAGGPIFATLVSDATAMRSDMSYVPEYGILMGADRGVGNVYEPFVVGPTTTDGDLVTHIGNVPIGDNVEAFILTFMGSSLIRPLLVAFVVTQKGVKGRNATYRSCRLTRIIQDLEVATGIIVLITAEDGAGLATQLLMSKNVTSDARRVVFPDGFTSVPPHILEPEPAVFAFKVPLAEASYFASLYSTSTVEFTGTRACILPARYLRIGGRTHIVPVMSISDPPHIINRAKKAITDGNVLVFGANYTACLGTVEAWHTSLAHAQHRALGVYPSDFHPDSKMVLAPTLALISTPFLDAAEKAGREPSATVSPLYSTPDHPPQPAHPALRRMSDLLCSVLILRIIALFIVPFCTVNMGVMQRLKMAWTGVYMVEMMMAMRAYNDPPLTAFENFFTGNVVAGVRQNAETLLALVLLVVRTGLRVPFFPFRWGSQPAERHFRAVRSSGGDDRGTDARAFALRSARFTVAGMLSDQSTRVVQEPRCSFQGTLDLGSLEGHVLADDLAFVPGDTTESDVMRCLTEARSAAYFKLEDFLPDALAKHFGRTPVTPATLSARGGWCAGGIGEGHGVALGTLLTTCCDCGFSFCPTHRGPMTAALLDLIAADPSRNMFFCDSCVRVLAAASAVPPTRAAIVDEEEGRDDDANDGLDDDLHGDYAAPASSTAEVRCGRL